jgi:hypothetical protein
MPGTWDAETYRDRARKWRAEADALPPGKARDGCVALAEGYADLVAILEKKNQGGSSQKKDV